VNGDEANLEKAIVRPISGKTAVCPGEILRGAIHAPQLGRRTQRAPPEIYATAAPQYGAAQPGPEWSSIDLWS
jgi:hypothetical protein